MWILKLMYSLNTEYQIKIMPWSFLIAYTFKVAGLIIVL